MGSQGDFRYLIENSERFLANPELCQTKEGLIDLICHNCQFWRQDEHDYECGAFKLLRLLLEKGPLSVEDIVRAVGE